ncbi:hypothetical protein KL943_000273 [Ogataea angusta]|nr:hypothetical protein KL943_000273 [Ogataea angusta]
MAEWLRRLTRIPVRAIKWTLSAQVQILLLSNFFSLGDQIFFIMTRGVLIAIEGLDRTGKTTQTLRLLERLDKHGVDATLIKFPERTTPIGKIINSYLTDKAFELSDQSAHLLFSANRWELAEKIRNLLESGRTVALDRYVYSGVAYSSAKGLPFDWCLSPDIGLPKPDIVLFMKFEHEENVTREGFGEERYEVAEFQQKVRTQFEKFQNEDNWKTIYVDNKSIEEVEEIIWAEYEATASRERKALQKFTKLE